MSKKKRNDRVQGRTHKGVAVSNKQTSLQALVDRFGGEQELVTFVEKALQAKEAGRLYRKERYLRDQEILRKAKEAGITS